ncbi:hypothetical protein Pfo_006923 [Paulownia fortunei]|nr:hypothetical protein Pfo_006923 [Paulownia fortunei]
MGKSKGRKEIQQTLILADESGGFFACYLLTSLCPRFKGHTYIGYTLNPRRRIRQHNGEIGSGAWRTKRKRPWEMVLCIYGFPTNIAALQFEWAWQHPVESLAVRSAAASFKSLSGLANKIKLAYTMLTLPAWQSLNLTVNLFSTKYQKYTSGCPAALPEQMRTHICSMDELPCYNVNARVNDEFDGDECEGSFQESTEEESTGAAKKFHDSPSYDGSSEENVHQQINHRDDASGESSGCSAKNWVGWLGNSLPICKEDQGPPIIINDSPARTSFSFTSSYIVEDMQSPRLVELTTEFDQPLKKQLTTALVADENQLLIKSPDIISHEVEIIDILTPSPCYPVNSGSKKRRPTLCHEIIDLTNSPMFV